MNLIQARIKKVAIAAIVGGAVGGAVGVVGNSVHHVAKSFPEALKSLESGNADGYVDTIVTAAKNANGKQLGKEAIDNLKTIAEADFKTGSKNLIPKFADELSKVKGNGKVVKIAAIGAIAGAAIVGTISHLKNSNSNRRRFRH